MVQGSETIGFASQFSPDEIERRADQGVMSYGDPRARHGHDTPPPDPLDEETRGEQSIPRPAGPRRHKPRGTSSPQEDEITFDPDAGAIEPLPGDQEHADLETATAVNGLRLTHVRGSIIADNAAMNASKGLPSQYQTAIKNARQQRREQTRR